MINTTPPIISPYPLWQHLDDTVTDTDDTYFPAKKKTSGTKINVKNVLTIYFINKHRS